MSTTAEPYEEALARAAAHARGNGSPRSATVRSVHARRPMRWQPCWVDRCQPPGVSPRRCDRRARDRCRSRTDGNRFRPIFRLGHGRHAAGRTCRRLDGQRLGPERGHAVRNAGRRSCGRGRRPLVAGDTWSSTRSRCRLRDGRDDGQLHGTRSGSLLRAGSNWVGRASRRTVWCAESSRAGGGGAARHGSTSPCAISGLGSQLWWLPTTRAAYFRMRLPGRWGKYPLAIPSSSVCRLGTSTRAPSIRSMSRLPSLVREMLGCTSTARSVCRAAASPDLEHLTAGVQEADSWATDAHKTLNVPYDCGVAIVRDPKAMRMAFGLHTSYLVNDESGLGDPYEKVPELSRRARGVPVWAVLRSLGRDGVGQLVGGLAARAGEIAAGVAEIDGVEVLNDVVYTQICVAVGDAARTAEVAARLVSDGTAWMSASHWSGRDILRISVSNWSTDDVDVQRSVDALRRAVNGQMSPRAIATAPRCMYVLTASNGTASTAGKPGFSPRTDSWRVARFSTPRAWV